MLAWLDFHDACRRCWTRFSCVVGTLEGPPRQLSSEMAIHGISPGTSLHQWGWRQSWFCVCVERAVGSAEVGEVGNLNQLGKAKNRPDKLQYVHLEAETLAENADARNHEECSLALVTEAACRAQRRGAGVLLFREQGALGAEFLGSKRHEQTSTTT